jgi:hypothetical protein
MIDEYLDLRFQICREEVVLQQDAVFQGLMPSLDLALCLRVIRRTPDRSNNTPILPRCPLSGVKQT